MTPYSKFDTDIPSGVYDLLMIGTSHICDSVEGNMGIMLATSHS